MPRITRSPRARQDLIDIWTWIAADNPKAADRLLDLIHEKLLLLAENPRLGPVRPDIAPGLRLFPLRRYLILYREQSQGIEVVRVVHGMRRLEDIA
jgi:toxin ParE1/3/4